MIRIHEDLELFREAVRFSQPQTGFAARLIEKDYFCSVMLEYLAAFDTGLVFKGGTCLSKAYAEFYRLSEDLDFVIPTPTRSKRSERSKLAAGLKEAIVAIPREQQVIRIVQPLKGANSSRQYIAVVGYTSLISGQEETIKIEVGLREPLLTPTHNGSVRTILLDPVSGQRMVKPIPVRCIARIEAFAEKIRAALTRREVAIRDYYDIDHAVRQLGIRLDDTELVRLVRKKLAVPGNDAVDMSEVRMGALRRQFDAQLKPVLRDRDYAEFDLESAIEAVIEMAGRLA